MSRLVVLIVCLAVVLSAAGAALVYLYSQGVIGAPGSAVSSQAQEAAQASSTNPSGAAATPSRNRPAPVIPARKVDSLDDSQVVWDSEERRAAWEARKKAN